MQAQMNFKLCKFVELLHAFHPLGNSSPQYFMLALVFELACVQMHIVFSDRKWHRCRHNWILTCIINVKEKKVYA